MFEFECQQCGDCCRASNQPNTRTWMVWTDADIARIAAHLELDEDAFCSLAGIKDNALETTHLDCPFLEDDGSCAIHDVKPELCTRWPYITLRNNPNMLEQGAAKCRGLKITGR